MSELDGLRTWLSRTGIPFEFAAASAFREAGFQVYQGIHYPANDAEAVAARDIDVLAVREQLVARHPMTRATVIFVVECKTASQPWLIFRGHSDGGKWDAVGRFPMNHVSEDDVLGALEWDQEPWLLRLPADSGFRVMATWKGAASPNAVEPTVPRKNHSRDPGFDAVRQVVDAAEGLLRGDPQHLPTVAIPVLAISSSLYAVRLDDGHEQIEPVDWERVLWRGLRTAEVRAIDVVAGDALAAYAREAWAGAEEFLPILRAAALRRREDEMRRASEFPSALNRTLLAGEAIAEGVQKTVDRARRAISSRFR